MNTTIANAQKNMEFQLTDGEVLWPLLKKWVYHLLRLGLLGCQRRGRDLLAALLGLFWLENESITVRRSNSDRPETYNLMERVDN